ncbi:MAG: YggS family pyridoxal phosphate-dependent enzyme [bacterium]|nr:YggS family pyridoxal phosphate-dependent enzyme [bacterium]
MTIHENVLRVQAAIEAACSRVHRDPAGVRLVAVSKTRPVTDVEAAAAAGVQHFGENRVEESQIKIPAVASPVSWHMIGHIQSRKAKAIPGLFQWVHSVDSVALAERLSRLAVEQGTTLDVLVQVNVSGEETKGGLEAVGWEGQPAVREQVMQDMQRLVALPGLHVQGLMTMAPIVDEMEQARPVFASLSALRETLRQTLNVPLPELSMGMTDDYPVAIEEGATMLRIGRAIFGERPVEP